MTDDVGRSARPGGGGQARPGGGGQARPGGGGQARPGGGRPARPAAPPAILDPIFALIERIDRRRRRIRPLRPDGVLGIEVRRHRGRTVTLRDGSEVRAGERIVDLHLDNTRIAGLWSEGWQAAFGTGAADLRACAAWLATLPAAARPVAIRSGGLLTVGAARLGFEVGPPRGGFMGALESWYLRGLLVRWSRAGRARLDRGREPLRAREAWLSATALLERFGQARPPGPTTTPARGSERTVAQGSETSTTNGPSDRPTSTRRSGPNGPRPSADSE
jgi:hypothetical protein